MSRRGPNKTGRRRASLCVLLAIYILGGCALWIQADSAIEERDAATDRRAAIDGGPAAGASHSADATLLARHLAFEDAVSQYPLVTGNEVTLLVDGPATYEAMFAAVEQAEDHVHVETYIIEDDEIGRRFADLLIRKQAQGVKVRLIYDSVGSLNTPKAFFERLADRGVELVEYNPINPLMGRQRKWRVNNRDHRKLMVVDGQVAFLGGINISDVYSSGSFGKSGARATPSSEAIPWRDTHVQIRGPVVADFQRIFLKTWRNQTGLALSDSRYFPTLHVRGNDRVRAMVHIAEEDSNPIYAAFVSAIDHAVDHIYLTNAYFVPRPRLLKSLCQARRRGVDVKLILPSRSDFWLVFHAGRTHYTQLLRCGVEIYERREALLHAKTILIDGVWSSVGSTNLDWRSLLHNDELNAIILGPDFAAQLQTLFEKDLAKSARIDRATWRRRGVHVRALEWIARWWSYWL